VLAEHAGAAADVALPDRPTARAGERGQDVLRPDVPADRVVEEAVEGLGHDRADEVARAEGWVLAGQPLDRRAVDGPDRVGVGQQDRAFEQAELIDLRAAGDLAGAVQDRDRGRDRVEEGRPLVRVDRGQAGPHRPLADAQSAVAGDQGRVADPQARHVGDRVEAAGREGPDLDPEVVQARARRHGEGAYSIASRSTKGTRTIWPARRLPVLATIRP
jgi:hypothetical protein